jgi:hypothetical protein
MAGTAVPAAGGYRSVPVDPALRADGFVVVEGFVDRRLARTLYTLLVLRTWRGEAKRDDQVPTAGSFWGDATLDAVLLGLRPDVEAVTACPLVPTYAYARLYGRGDGLARHRDRAAAEVAVTVHLGHDGGEPPPICFAPGGAVRQRPGDAVVYRGDRVEHWRDEYTGTAFGQLFLNYVLADGDRRDLAFDGRAGAFPPSMR